MADDVQNDGRHDEHSTYSASSSYRWSAPDGCPASAILTKLAPPKPSSDAANEGTQAHELIEKTLKGEPFDPAAYPEKAHEGAEIALDFIRSHIPHSAVGVWIEHKCTWHIADWLPAQDEVYGYPDAIVFDPSVNRLDLFDYKHGVWPVSAENNRQLLQGVVSAVDTLNIYPMGLDVYVHIIQPFGFDDEPIKSWHVTQEAWDRHTSETLAAIEANAAYHLAGDIDGLTYRPSAKNCHWCAGFATCPAVRRAAKPKQLDPENLPALTPENVAEALKDAEFLKVWIKEIEALAFDMAKNGVDLPGLKLVQKRGKRIFVAQETEVLNKLWTLARVARDDAMPRSLVSPAQAEKLIKDKLKSLGHDNPAIKKKLDELAFLMDKPGSSNLDLVSIDDPRPAVDARQKFFGGQIQAHPQNTQQENPTR